MKNLMNISFSALIYLSLLICFSVNAELKTISVLNPLVSQAVYEVAYETHATSAEPKSAEVVKSKKTKTKLEQADKTGIYAIQKNGKLVPIIYGNVLGVSKGFNGILEIGSGADSPAIVVVDGKLLVINSASNVNEPSSRIELGSKSAPILDLFTKRAIQLPLITSLDQIRVQKVKAPGGYYRPTESQGFIISVKSNHPMGTGFTFYAEISYNYNDEKDKLKFIGKNASLITFDFERPEVMARLYDLEDPYNSKIYSPLLLDYIENLLLKEVSRPYFDRYIELLRKQKSILLSSKAEFTVYAKKHGEFAVLMGTAPYYQINTQSIAFDMLFLERFPGTKLYQSFMPLDKKWLFSIDTASGDIPLFTKIPTYQGKNTFWYASDNTGLAQNGIVVPNIVVDYNQKQQKYLVHQNGNLSMIKSQGMVSVISFHGEPKLFQLPATTTGLDLSSDESARHSYLIGNVEVERDTKIYYLIVSYQNKNKKGKTFAFLYSDDKNSSGQMQFISGEQISTEFYSQDELAARVRNHNHEYSSSKNIPFLLFDNLLPPKGYAAYIKTEFPKHPFYNILNPIYGRTKDYRNISSLPKYVQLHPVKTSEFSPSLVHKTFDTKLKDIGTTGFYFKNDFISSGIYLPKIKNGALVSKNDIKPDTWKAHVLDTSVINFTKYEDSYEWMPNIEFKIIPISKKDNIAGIENVDTFELMLLVSPASLSSDAFVPFAIKTMEIKSAYRNLMGVKLIQGKRQSETELDLLIMFERGDNPAINSSGIYNVHMKLDFNQSSRTVNVKMNSPNFLSRENASVQMLKDRLQTDTRGTYYWVEKPEISPDKSAYAVRSLASPARLLYPNQGDKIQLRHSDIFSNSDGISSLSGAWYLYGPSDLKRNINGLHEDMLKIKKQLEANEAKRSSPFDFFPGFKDYLDQLATPSKTPGKRQIVIVEEKLKKDFMNALYFYLLEGDGKFSLQYKKNKNFALYLLDESSNMKEVREELRIIANRGSQTAKLLLAELGKMNSNFIGSSSDSDSDNESEEETEENEESLTTRVNKKIEKNQLQKLKNRRSRLALLASDGKVDNIADYIKYAKSAQPVEVPMLIVATPEEVSEMIKQHNVEDQNAMFESFHFNHVYQTSSWTVWHPTSSFVSTEIKQRSTAPLSSEELKIFPSLESLLNQAATGQLRGKQIILKVPNGLKSLVDKLIQTRWANLNYEITGNWSHRNQNLSFFKVSGDRDANTQEVVLQNLQAMRAKSDTKNVVLYSDLAHLNRIGRPVYDGSSRPYFLKDPSAKNQTEFLTDEADSSEENRETESETRHAPHIFWMIATEGQKVALSTARDWNFRKNLNPSITSLTIATKQELEDLESNMSLESRFIDIQKDFEIINFIPPDEKVKYDLMRTLLEKPEIRSLDYRYNVGDHNNEESRRQIILHLINRTEQIAISKNQEPTEAFVRVFTEFRRSLLEDTELRRKRNIDRKYVDRFFTKVFPMQLSLEILENTDPLKRISETNSIVRQWRENGYEGPNDLKERVLSNILSQTRPSDSGRPIPSSVILYGGTSSGKTFLIKNLLDLLDIQFYDFYSNNNEEAEAILIHPSMFKVDKEDSSSGKFSIDEMITHIEKLLSGPKGHRAWIIFDDVHKTQSAEIHKKLIAYIQSFFDTTNGMIRVKNSKIIEGKTSVSYRDIPVQNLNLVMTLNPEKDKEQVRRFADHAGDLKGLVLASISREGFKAEESFLARWSDIINLDQFPRSAKVPALLSKVRESAKHSDSFVLVEPEAINNMVKVYPNAHAREFLTPAAVAITSIPASAKKSNLYIVTPANMQHISKHNPYDRIDSMSLNYVVRDVTHITPITTDNLQSQLLFISFMMNNFRQNLYNHLVLTTENSDLLNLNISSAVSMLRNNFVFALGTHNFDLARIPLNEILIRQKDIPYLNKLAQEEFFKLKNSSQESTIFPFQFNIREVNFNFDDFDDANNDFTQTKVVSDLAKKLELQLMELFLLQMGLDKSVQASSVLYWDNQDFQNWFDRLDTKQSSDKVKRISNEILKTYLEFQRLITDSNLQRDITNDTSLSLYDISRLFAFSLDKAISRLPWTIMSKFSMNIVDYAKENGMDQKPNFVEYVFKTSVSPFAVSSNDVVADIVDGLVQRKQNLVPIAQSSYFRPSENALRCAKSFDGVD